MRKSVDYDGSVLLMKKVTLPPQLRLTVVFAKPPVETPPKCDLCVDGKQTINATMVNGKLRASKTQTTVVTCAKCCGTGFIK